MKKILIIEDDLTIRFNTTEFLKEEGFEIITAPEGVTGVQLALESVPDLILCDISMPRMDGYEVLKTLHSIPATSSIPFIFMTAKAQKDELRLGMQLGVDDYITKPFTFDELLASVKVRLEKHEKLIRSYESKYLSLIENPLVGVFIISENKFRYMNSKFVKILKFRSDSELFGISFEQLLPDEEKAEILEKLSLSQKDILPQVQLKCRLFSREREIIPVALYLSYLKMKGEPCTIGYIQKSGTSDLLEVTGENMNYLEEISGAVQKVIEYHKIKPEDLIKVMREQNALTVMSNPDDLTKREIEIIQLISEGFSNREIAEKLFISQRTVDTHKANILMKSGANHIAALMVYAMKNNMIKS